MYFYRETFYPNARESNDHTYFESLMHKNDNLIVDGSEMGALIRSKDWSQTPIGSPESWSESLRVMVNMLLSNRFPLLLWWGPEFVQIYNDAYRPILGSKHPLSLGQPLSECWSEIWDVLKPLVETPFGGGPATWMEDILLEINRYGYTEETHFTIAYSAVPDEKALNGIGGVLATVHEISEKVVGERRISILRDLGVKANEAKTVEEACALASQTINAHPTDIPFALLYLIDADGKYARLAGAAGIEVGKEISSIAVDLRTEGSAWPFYQALKSERVLQVNNLAKLFKGVPSGPWSEAPHSAVVIPIPSNKAHHYTALLVAGVSSRLQFNEAYENFFELLRSQISTIIANARAFEEERKRAEALAEIDRAKTTFFSNVSHEFRTPLTLLLGPLSDTIEEAVDLTPSQRKKLQVALRNALRLQKLVNTLLDFSRIEEKRVQAYYQETNLSELTTEIASMFQSAFEKAGLELVVDCSPLAEKVYVDRDMWEKIVLNLISNSFKHTFQGKVRINQFIADNSLLLKITDTGVGIPPEQLPDLFERFHRVPNARSRTHEGSGIGLALVQELVRLHGGEIAVESVVDKGTTFTVSIPTGDSHLPHDKIRPNSIESRQAVGAQPYVQEALRWLPPEGKSNGNDISRSNNSGQEIWTGVANKGRARIVLADDNADMRDYIHHLLEPHCEVQAVSNGLTALEVARANPPDLIISDVMMPGLDGLQLLNALRADESLKKVWFILLSAKAGEEAKIEGLQAGADDYLTKPFNAKELVARIKANLEMYRVRYQESEKVLKRNEDLYKTIANASPASLWMSDKSADLIYINQTWIDWTGRSLESHLGKGWLESVLPADRERTEKKYLEDFEARRDFRGEFRIQRFDGEIRWCEKEGNPVYGSSGDFEGYVGYCSDITDRKNSEESLRESEARFRTMADNIPNLAWMADAAGWIFWYNKKWYEYTGTTPEQMEGWGWQSVHHPDELPKVLEGWKTSIQIGRPFDMIFPLKGADGVFRPFLTRVLPVRNSQDEIVQWFGTNTDVTAQIQVEMALKESSEKFRTVFEALPQMTWTNLPTGEVNFFNQKWYNYTGLDFDQTKNWAWQIVVHSDDLEHTTNAYKEALLSGRVFQIENRIRKYDGTYRWHLTRALPIKSENNEIILWVGTATDIHKQKMAEEQLESIVRERTVQLERSNQDLQQFAHVASHDLKEPLRKIRTFSFRLEEEFGNTLAEKAKVYLGKIHSATERMNNMIEGVLTYSKADGAEDIVETVDLNQVIKNIENDLEVLINQNRAVIQLSTLPVIEGANVLMYQLFYNLINNSIKFSRPATPPVVLISATDLKINGRDFTQVRVEDNGIGFEQQYAHKIFVTFARLHSKDMFEGTGLGLSLCKKIVERFKGSIEAIGQRNIGATFIINLPYKQTDSGD